MATNYRLAEYTRKVEFAPNGSMAMTYVGEWELVEIVREGVSHETASRLKEVHLRPLLGTSDQYRTKFEIEQIQA